MERKLRPQDIAELKAEKLGHELRIREIGDLIAGKKPEEETTAIAPIQYKPPLYSARWRVSRIKIGE